jgi:O-succinylbenzoate synthase
MGQTIDQVGLTHLQLPTKDTCGGREARWLGLRDTILVTLTTRDGRVGLGECAPPLGRDLASAVARCWQELTTSLPPLLLGQPVATLDEFEALLPRDGSLHPSARAGVETAAWDLIGQRQERTLASMLGASEARIAAGIEPSVALGACPTVVDLLRSLEPHRDEGVRTFMVSISPSQDVDLLASVQRHFPECQFAADAGRRYSRSQLDVFKQIDELDLLWIDDPLPPEDFEGLAALQAELVTPLCVDATQTTVLRRGGCRLARLEVQRAGGLAAARRLHDSCLAHQVGCRVCTGPESGVGLAQALALATLPNCKDPSGLAPAGLWFADVFVKPALELDEQLHGRFRVSTRPGLGHAVDWVRIREHQVKHEEFLRQ